MEDFLTLKEFIAFAKGEKSIVLKIEDVISVRKARLVLEELMKSRQIYGVNTGIGAMYKQKIADEDFEEFQKNLILNHAAGVGGPMEKDITRGALFLLINTLKKGYSGIRFETLNFLVEMFNKELIPVVPDTGSLGASGDLIPLAHLVLPLIGKGLIWPRRGEKSEFGDYGNLSFLVFKKERLQPPKLQAGEALALINGTHFSTSILAFLAYEAADLCFIADLASAMTAKALHCNSDAFREEITDLKPYFGQIATAINLRKMFGETGDPPENANLQDGYSLRCVPQVHGAVRETVSFVRKIVTTEMNSVSANPVIDCEKKKIYSGGNFHGQPIALAADSLAIALCSLSGISERRIERLLNPVLSGLPPFLSSEPGIDSGLMMVQYTAVALNARNKVLAHPASTGSVPVSASQEDFVSLAATAALKAGEILKNVQYVLAIEILCASRAMDFCEEVVADDSGVAKARRLVRQSTGSFGKDKPLSRDIQTLFDLIKTGRLTAELKGISV